MNAKDNLARLILSDANEAADQAVEDYRNGLVPADAQRSDFLRRVREKDAENKIRTRVSNLPAESQERADFIVLLTIIDRLRENPPV